MSDDPALIETMARGIYPRIAWAYKWDGNTPFDQLNDHAIGVLLDTARAALSTLRSAGMAVVPREEPSGAMIDAALASDPYWSINIIPRLKRAYRAMLATAQP